MANISPVPCIRHPTGHHVVSWKKNKIKNPNLDVELILSKAINKKINFKNQCVVSKKEAPDGWVEVVNKTLNIIKKLEVNE